MFALGATFNIDSRVAAEADHRARYDRADDVDLEVGSARQSRNAQLHTVGREVATWF